MCCAGCSSPKLYWPQQEEGVKSDHLLGHIKRQATRQDCLLSAQLAGRRGQMNWNSVCWGIQFFVLSWLEQTKTGQKSLGPAQWAQRNKKGKSPVKGLSYVLLESPFASVNSQQGPSLSGLCAPARNRPQYPYMAKIHHICSVADPDPGSEFVPSWVQDPGSRVKKIPYSGSGSASKN